MNYPTKDHLHRAIYYNPRHPEMSHEQKLLVNRVVFNNRIITDKFKKKQLPTILQGYLYNSIDKAMSQGKFSPRQLDGESRSEIEVTNFLFQQQADSLGQVIQQSFDTHLKDSLAEGKSMGSGSKQASPDPSKRVSVLQALKNDKYAEFEEMVREKYHLMEDDFVNMSANKRERKLREMLESNPIIVFPDKGLVPVTGLPFFSIIEDNLKDITSDSMRSKKTAIPKKPPIDTGAVKKKPQDQEESGTSGATFDLGGIKGNANFFQHINQT